MPHHTWKQWKIVVWQEEAALGYGRRVSMKREASRLVKTTNLS